ncbi:histidine triad nucleotide-binding protein [Patescibacteria group bacterium]|nr:histidine triad nucleotide-binding protein [Patescibacteria group bacterium]
MMDCLFCKISKKEISSDIVCENDNFLAFKDINPKADFHTLIIPKKHIESIKELQSEDKELIGEMFLFIKEIARDKNLKGYKIAINVGKEGGQFVEHLHAHLLAGEIKEVV